MKITRRGARADNGPSSIELTSPEFNLTADGVIVQDRDIGDFVTKAHHNYKITISLGEVGCIIDALGEFSEERREEIGRVFENRLKSLLRITQSCINV